jgi:hypothetical protein
MANIKDFIKKIGNSAVSLEEQQQALAQVEQTIIEAKQKRTEAVGKNADMVIQALKTIEAKLEAKLNELNNTPAKQGVQGPAGQDGKNGKDGKAGRDGISGKDGTDGKDGVDGKDGISVVDAKIDFDGSLVVYLSNGSEIDCGQILQPEVAKNIIISSGGSGTSQVVTDTLVSLQNQINTLTGIDGVLGDMAQQNANAVDITGGTINGTTIGATTPSTVNATTITGQTGVLRGTGQNLYTFSEQLNNANWGKTGSSVSGTNTTTAPDGTLTADTYLISNTSAQHFIFQSITSINATSYTLSFYVKKNTGDFIQLLFSSATFGSNAFANFDINTGVLGTVGSATTATITSAGNGWYRCAITAPATSSGAGNMSLAFIQNATDARLPTYLGNGTDSVYLWGAQFELASSVGTYIPTTTTAVYGTPTLSFSGVSTIGLESNGSLFVQPAGTGALQAQATTSTTAGGNARGANAVDWQTSRSSAGQVASGAFTTIVGGNGNTASGTYSVAGGFNNTTSGEVSFVGGGSTNTASGFRSVATGGWLNTSAGFMNFIGGGYTNSATSGSAVTTQSATMNATTAVTLSGSNANIKVGQYITGTSIAANTYVAAISGTSLTLSQNASGSSTSTLSFFTPHGVVVGGGNNQATGSYSFIGGGGDAGTSANRNVASGDWSFVGGGIKNTASGLGSFIGGGGYDGSSTTGNTASGVLSVVGGGLGNTASGSHASILGGRGNLADATRSTALGNFSATRSIVANIPMSACNAPISTANGVSQSAILVLAKQTTDATATALCSDGNAAGTTNQVILPNNSAYFFTGEVISGVTGGGNTKGWTIEGVIKRGANAASTALVGTPTVTSTYADAGASTWTIAVTADTTNGGIRVTFTGQASTTIRTVCQIRTTEMTY